MDLATYRKSRGLTQDGCAKELGLRTKSYVSMIESGARHASIKLALRIERWSGGAVSARSLCSPEEAALLPAEPPPAAPEAHA